MSEDLVQRKDAAVMFTDIVGYSKMMGEDEPGTMVFLKFHNDLIRKEVSNYEGSVIKTIGDAFMVDFNSSANAVRCALSIQKRFHDYNQSQKLSKQIRIGIHAGVVMVSENDIFGDVVNIAARIQPLAEPGGICVSHEVYSESKDRVNAAFVSLGFQNLKNITQKIAIYQIVMKRYPFYGFIFLKKWPLRKALVGILVLLVLFLGNQWYQQWKNNRDWNSWFVEDFKNFDKTAKNWDLRKDVNYYTFIPGQLFLGGRVGAFNPVCLLQPVPKQPFRIKIQFKTTSHKYSSIQAIATFRQSWVKTNEKLMEKLNYLIDILQWSGLAAEEDFEPDQKHIHCQLGSADSSGPIGLDESTKDQEGSPDGDQTLELTYDNDILRIKGSNNLYAETLIRDAEKENFKNFRFGIKGQNVVIESVEIFTKKFNPDLDLITAADNYRFQGQNDLALKLYSDLYQRSQSNDDRCRFLFKESLCSLAAGDKKAAVEELEHIIQNYPKNVYAGYALFDLGHLNYEEALKNKKSSKEIFIYSSREADKYFAQLIYDYPNHSQTSKAKYYSLLNLILVNDVEHAKTMAEEILEDPQSAYAQPVLQMLTGFIYKPLHAKDTSNPIAEIKYLDGIIGNHRYPRYLHETCLLESLQVCLSAGLKEDFFRLVENVVNDADFNNLNRLKAYQGVVTYENTFGNDLPLDTFIQNIKKSPSQAMSFFRRYISMCQNGQLVEIAKNYVKANVHLREGSGPVSAGPRTYYSFEKKGLFYPFGPSQENTCDVEKNEYLVFHYDTGKSWGCGVGFSPNVEPLVRENVVNLMGSRYLEFEAMCPKGLIFDIHINELGCDSDQVDYHPSSYGTDGEQYLLRGLKGTGQWHLYLLPLADFTGSPFWGNQDGNNVLDLQAIQKLEFILQGNQGKGDFLIKHIQFSPS